MASTPPIPQRIPPLRWRSPSFLWTPVSLAAAIGWPAAVVGTNQSALRLSLLTGATVFTLALLVLGANWARGQAPRDRRNVVTHVVWAGVAVYLLAPFFFSDLVSVAANGPAAQTSIGYDMSAALVPLSLLLGLPATLISALIFAWLAFEPPRKRGPVDVAIERGHVQPFE